MAYLISIGMGRGDREISHWYGVTVNKKTFDWVKQQGDQHWFKDLSSSMAGFLTEAAAFLNMPAFSRFDLSHIPKTKQHGFVPDRKPYQDVYCISLFSE